MEIGPYKLVNLYSYARLGRTIRSRPIHLSISWFEQDGSDSAHGTCTCISAATVNDYGNKVVGGGGDVWQGLHLSFGFLLSHVHLSVGEELTVTNTCHLNSARVVHDDFVVIT